MAPAGYDHGSITGRLTIKLGYFVLTAKLGDIVAAETGFIIARDPDTVRAPDLAFIRQSRIPQSGRPIKFWIGAPDLALETMSPSDTVFDVDEKVEEWLAAGTEIVWVLNPRQKTVTVHRSDKSVQRLAVGDTLDGEAVIPGFRIPVAEIFE